MGGKWSLVQIQSPRPFFLFEREAPEALPRGHLVSTGRLPEPRPRWPQQTIESMSRSMSPIARAEDFVSTRLGDLTTRLADHAYRRGAAVVAWLPERMARALGRAVADLCWRLSPRRRATLMQNLKRLLPDLDSGALGTESRRAFGGFGESVVDTLRLARAPRGELERRVQF